MNVTKVIDLYFPTNAFVFEIINLAITIFSVYLSSGDEYDYDVWQSDFTGESSISIWLSIGQDTTPRTIEVTVDWRHTSTTATAEVVPEQQRVGSIQTRSIRISDEGMWHWDITEADPGEVIIISYDPRDQFGNFIHVPIENLDFALSGGITGDILHLTTDDTGIWEEMVLERWPDGCTTHALRHRRYGRRCYTIHRPGSKSHHDTSARHSRRPRCRR
ncbi:MAG: hypothetical protein FWF78_08465 [Defluviitaleaceae bacterium]|nr:hypothetical protein [Defluviitaleaceae bacterium]